MKNRKGKKIATPKKRTSTGRHIKTPMPKKKHRITKGGK